MTMERSAGVVFYIEETVNRPSILDDPEKRAAFLKEARDFVGDRGVDPEAQRKQDREDDHPFWSLERDRDSLTESAPNMWETVNSPSVLDDPEKMAAFLQEGRDFLRDRGVDPEVQRKQDREYAEATRRMHQDRAALTEAHPYKWAAVGGDGLLALADSEQELVDDMKSRGLDGPQYRATYLDPDRPIPVL